MEPYVVPAEDRDTLDRRLNAFRKHKPPSFDWSLDPIAAARWLQALEKIFRDMQCSDPQKLMFSTNMLEGDAHEWWMNTSQAYELQGHIITWPFFEDCFLGRYFPYDAQERKQGVFDRLVQGLMSIDEYLAKFNELVKFTYFHMVVPTLTFLAAKFCRGHSEVIAEHVAGAASRDFGNNRPPSTSDMSSGASSMEDTASPYSLQSSDHPGLVLVTHTLDGTNYSSWNRAMLLALTAKNKSAFIDGSLPRPSNSDLLFPA
ncbi:uncharacterized protein LOC133302570 [Gastrolobium bilobum]|uniref:uncharacterized protein LOC133302570 n=1 Tax=Gastrolobium bilobum TaxID=150636 RepID=UPI002AB0F75C|nr:uncharacterized protein LOC133302570 [Gastrolobium bilobum]